MYRALIPIDASEDRAVAQARAVRDLPQAASEVEATLLHVFDPNRGGRGHRSTLGSGAASGRGEKLEDTSPTQIVSGKTADEELREAGITVETESREGTPAEEILACAREIQADVIVLGGRKRSPLGSILFGSVTQAVVLDADRPVMVTGDESADTAASGPEEASG